MSNLILSNEVRILFHVSIQNINYMYTRIKVYYLFISIQIV